MIYTLTLNPSFDREYRINEFAFNRVTRSANSRSDCGGKGLNVSRMLHALNTQNIAVALVGGSTGELLDQELQKLGIDTLLLNINDETRSNISIVQSDNLQHLKINEQGPSVSPQEIKSLTELVAKNVQKGDWWVLAGSLPMGCEPTIYRDLIRQIHKAGAFTILDTSGEALRFGCEATPTVVKPNMAEALGLIGWTDEESASARDVAKAVQKFGAENVVLSLGCDGAVLATAESVELYASAIIEEKNPTGAGDSLVAGLVWGLSQNHPIEYALRFGMACGAATAAENGTQLGSLHDIQRILGELESASAER